METETLSEGIENRLEDVAATGKPYELALTWRDGKSQTVNLGGLLAMRPRLGGMFANPEDFADVRVIAWGHGIEWANGLDCSAEMLAGIAEIQKLQSSDGAALIKDWQRRHKLSAKEAGELLGYKTAQITNYRSGKSKLPAAVRIAIHAMDEDPNLFAALYRPSERTQKRTVRAGTKKRVIEGVVRSSKSRAA